MKTQALKGMRDLLPAEQTLRDYIQGKILETYRASGFERISTPMLEDMENLDKSDGGDNLNLIFKVLKRGAKLAADLHPGAPPPLTAMGLRCELAARSEKLGYKIREAQLEKIPYMLVVGDRDIEAGTVSPRHRADGALGAMTHDAITAVLKDVEDNKLKK